MTARKERLEQVAKGGQPEPELIAGHPVGAHPRSLEIELHLLEVVFHLPAIALETLVKWRRLQSPGALQRVARKAFSGEVGHDECINGILLHAKILPSK